MVQIVNVIASEDIVYKTADVISYSCQLLYLDGLTSSSIPVWAFFGVSFVTGVDTSAICTSKMLVSVHCGHFVGSVSQCGP